MILSWGFITISFLITMLLCCIIVRLDTLLRKLICVEIMVIRLDNHRFEIRKKILKH